MREGRGGDRERDSEMKCIIAISEIYIVSSDYSLLITSKGWSERAGEREEERNEERRGEGREGFIERRYIRRDRTERGGGKKVGDRGRERRRESGTDIWR